MIDVLHITIARKPVEGSIISNVSEYGCGALNISKCRVGSQSRSNPPAGPRGKGVFGDGGEWERCGGDDIEVTGRFPSDVIFDGSNEVTKEFPVTCSGKPAGVKRGTSNRTEEMQNSREDAPLTGYGDSGSASRFFKECSDD